MVGGVAGGVGVGVCAVVLPGAVAVVAWSAALACDSAIEECRKACGGQGFLLSSGIAKLAPDFSEWVTVEGEQVILSL